MEHETYLGLAELGDELMTSFMTSFMNVLELTSTDDTVEYACKCSFKMTVDLICGELSWKMLIYPYPALVSRVRARERSR